jgi:hypothetical protein
MNIIRIIDLCFNFFSETLYVDIYGTAALIQLGITPDLLLYEIPRKHFSGIRHKQCQEVKFGFGQFHNCAAQIEGAGFEIDGKIPEVILVVYQTSFETLKK